jgi:hypothetical protein
LAGCESADGPDVFGAGALGPKLFPSVSRQTPAVFWYTGFIYAKWEFLSDIRNSVFIFPERRGEVAIYRK